MNLKDRILGKASEGAEGGEDMPDVPDELEIERVRNLIVGFGWEISKQEVFDDRVELTVVKKRESAEAETPPGPT